MVVYYYIYLFTGTLYISITVTIFSPCHSFIGVHHLINLLSRTEAFLVAAPDLNAFAVVPVLLVLHVRGLTPAPALLHLLHPNDTFFKRECQGGDSNPRPLAPYELI